MVYLQGLKSEKIINLSMSKPDISDCVSPVASGQMRILNNILEWTQDVDSIRKEQLRNI